MIFSSTLADDAEGCGRDGRRMVELSREQEGFIDAESASRTTEGFGITVSYWRDLESIRRWKSVSEHAAAQRMGRDAFGHKLPAEDRARRARVRLRPGQRLNMNTVVFPTRTVGSLPAQLPV